ncbi:uncharacterized protein [Prorops nasuta]|uniref:uncharacterized protein n=1 Tax=Prorops nasuta TaxID=863751 RepID=UPI0034CEE47B
MKVLLLLTAIFSCSFGLSENAEEWWQSMSLYQIYPRSFKDSDGDGIGDLKGITSKLGHLVDSNVNAFWLSPIYPSPMVDFGYDISDFRGIDPAFGSMDDFEQLVTASHKASLKVIMDFVPNHSSDKHEWFKKSLQNIEPYSDYYIWHRGRVLDNGTVTVPNNWVSVFGGSAWTWRKERQAYYFHQFAPEQPDLNYNNENVTREMKALLRFWLRKGVDGFRVDAVPHLFEDRRLLDEPLTGTTNDPNNYGYTDKIYTKDQPATYNMVTQWTQVLDEFTAKDKVPRVMMIEAYANISMTMKYYEAGANFPFNFWLINTVDKNSKALDYLKLIDNWMANMPKGSTANWVAGNHDNNRLASRVGQQKARLITMLTLLLPGVSVTYSGEEIGMEDTWVSWEDTKDPQGCNAGREGYERASRDPERSPFQWDDSTSAGFSRNPKTWLPVNKNYKTLNLAMQKTQEGSYYHLYLEISALKSTPVMRKGNLHTKLLGENVLALSRQLKGAASVYVIMNFGNQAEQVDLSTFSGLPKPLRLYYATQFNVLPEQLDDHHLNLPAETGAVFIGSPSIFLEIEALETKRIILDYSFFRSGQRMSYMDAIFRLTIRQERHSCHQLQASQSPRDMKFSLNPIQPVKPCCNCNESYTSPCGAGPFFPLLSGHLKESVRGKVGIIRLTRSTIGFLTVRHVLVEVDTLHIVLTHFSLSILASWTLLIIIIVLLLGCLYIYIMPQPFAPDRFAIMIGARQQCLVILLIAVTYSTAVIRNIGWWKNTVFYQVYPRSFKDSDGDGVGDIRGIIDKLAHFSESGVGAIWLSPINRSPMKDAGYDISDFKDIDPLFGKLTDFEELINKAKLHGLKVILDLVPNHTSDLHEWFEKSRNKQGKYTDYYIWRDGKGDGKPPNNWISVFNGPAWTFDETRRQWYFHQFLKEQPDLNYRNPDVQDEMRQIIEYWLRKGIQGFRVDAVPHLFEDINLTDEKLLDKCEDTDLYACFDHQLTKDQPETYNLIYSWRKILDDYAKFNNEDEKVMMTEAYTTLGNTTKFYTYGSHIPFNFQFIMDLDKSSSAKDFSDVINRWMKNMPEDGVANWVMGNHDRNRTASRYPDRGDQMTMLAMILPGVAVTYYGEEIGMVNNDEISWDETQDPQGCNVGKELFKSRSRDPARTPFQWDDTTAGGFSNNSKPWLPMANNYRTLNLKNEKSEDDSHFKIYQKLTALRKTDVLTKGVLETALLNDDKILAILRKTSNETISLLVNFSDDEEQSVNLASRVSGVTKVYVTSLGSGFNTTVPINLEHVELPAGASVVLHTISSAVGLIISLKTMFFLVVAVLLSS